MTHAHHAIDLRHRTTRWPTRPLAKAGAFALACALGWLVPSGLHAQDAEATSVDDDRLCTRVLLHVATLPDVDPSALDLRCHSGAVHVDVELADARSWTRLRDSVAALDGVNQVLMARPQPEGANDADLPAPAPVPALWIDLGSPREALALPEPESEDSLHRAASGDRPRTYTVQAGDSLSRIAARTMDDGNAWRRLYELNRNVIGPNPDGLREGMVLRVPQD